MRLIPGCLLLMLLVSNLSPVHETDGEEMFRMSGEGTATACCGFGDSMMSSCPQFLCVRSEGVLETMIINSKCRCMRTVRIQPRLQHIKRVKTTVPWEGCSDPEVIVWLKNKSILCLDPGANTTQSLLRNLPKKRKLSHLILPAPVKT